MCKEFDLRKVNYVRQYTIPLKYKGEIVNCDLKLDILVEKEVIVELKAVESILPVHTAQLLTYLKLANKRLGLLINFNVPMLVNGFKRIINNKL